MELRMYHFHDVNPELKEHIRDYDSNTESALCGHKHHNLSSNGDIITLEWAKKQILSASANGTVCKKCAKIAMKMLENQAEKTSRN